MLRRILLTLFMLSLPAMLWSADFDEIQKNKSLTIGIRKLSTATYLGSEYTYKGFCHDLAEAFARDIGVDLNLRIVDHFSHYWMKNGNILLKGNEVATPDIYDEIDIAADIITVNDQRQKYVKMTPFIENSEIFIGSIDLEVRDYEDLRGLRIITIESVNFFPLLKKELELRSIPYCINPIKVDDSGKMVFLSERTLVPSGGVEILVIPRDTPYVKYTNYTQILLGNADLSIQDSFSFFLHYASSKVFREGLRTLFPLNDEMGYLSFCTSYKTVELNEKLEDFINRYKTTKGYKDMFYRYMGISSEDYLELLQLTQRVK